MPQPVGVTEEELCWYECMSHTSCQGFDDYECDRYSPNPGDLCDEECYPRFTCDEGTLIDPRDYCDYFPNCPDGSDELGCVYDFPILECGDGQVVPLAERGNDDVECDNGADEEGCAVWLEGCSG